MYVEIKAGKIKYKFYIHGQLPLMINRRKFIQSTALTTGAVLSTVLSSSCNNSNVAGDTKKSNSNPVKYFLHGVASGDPLSSQVIIWTKISPDQEGSVVIKWFIAGDAEFKKIIQSGEVITNTDKDYTIKIDIENLFPSTTYYYRFVYNGIYSPKGRTKTTPADGYENISFAVVSCSDYSAGYYHALARVAEKKTLNAVIHLGDYMYEGTLRLFDPTHPVYQDELESIRHKRTREWWLRYYRRRYSINRMDTDMQDAHQAHPFITIWDDHEIADNTWKRGAKDHDPEIDGDWEVRKSAARQAYSEWMPIRGDASTIYRSIRFGKMAELTLLDCRLEGRDEQIYDADNQGLHAPERTMLGKNQKEWLFRKLDTSPCHWKLIANSVVFSAFNVTWADLGGQFTQKIKELQHTLLDYWEGYPDERAEIINHISEHNINNTVILSASMHCALAFDVTACATCNGQTEQPAMYNPVTGKGSVAVEFAATSITSDNFDEKMGKLAANTFQSLINRKLPQPFNYNPNPHLKFADLQRHGYYILKLSQARAEAAFYFVDDIKTHTNKEMLAAKWHTASGRNRLEKS